jgi:hypothetical protein
MEEHRGRTEETSSRKKREAGQVFPPPLVFPFPGKPASLTEGGQPVVCWPAYETPAERKKFRSERKKLDRIEWTSCL